MSKVLRRETYSLEQVSFPRETYLSLESNFSEHIYLLQGVSFPFSSKANKFQETYSLEEISFMKGKLSSLNK